MSYKDKTHAIKKQNQWIAETYDRINLTVPKGEKAKIKEYAESHGESVNKFICRLIEQEMNRGNNR